MAADWLDRLLEDIRLKGETDGTRVTIDVEFVEQEDPAENFPPDIRKRVVEGRIFQALDSVLASGISEHFLLIHLRDPSNFVDKIKSSGVVITDEVAVDIAESVTKWRNRLFRMIKMRSNFQWN